MAAKMTLEEAQAIFGIYGRVIDEADLVDAAQMRGVDGELATLRVKVMQLMEERPQEIALMLRGMEMIVRTAAARYRMSERRTDDLAQALAAAAKHFGDQLAPQGFGDV